LKTKEPVSQELVDSALRADQQSIARLMTLIERRASGVEKVLAFLQHRTGKAHIIGITGPPGSGKSTLVSELTRRYRESGRSVGVLAVDPSSSFSGGAILGDRIRMASHSGDSDVFIRSLATRGALGGLSRAVMDCVTVLDASGKQVIIIETVGVGQAEVDIVRTAHTVAVVSVPGLGDDVQVIKAGLLEIADIHIVNKGDREGSNRTVAELRNMMHLAPPSAQSWSVPIVRTIATSGEGTSEAVGWFDAHHGWLESSGELKAKILNIAARRIQWTVDDLVSRIVTSHQPHFLELAGEVAEGRRNPYDAALALLQFIQCETKEDIH